MSIKSNPDLVGYYTLRQDIMHLADEENKTRLALIEIQEKKSKSIAELVEVAEKLMGKAFTELGADGDLKKEFGGPKEKMPEAETDVQAVADHVRPGRRTCGLCHKPGHRAPNCPDAHLIQEQKKQAAKEPKVKRKRKAMTEEQRQAAAARLVKARAARGKKK